MKLKLFNWTLVLICILSAASNVYTGHVHGRMEHFSAEQYLQDTTESILYFEEWNNIAPTELENSYEIDHETLTEPSVKEIGKQLDPSKNDTKEIRTESSEKILQNKIDKQKLVTIMEKGDNSKTHKVHKENTITSPKGKIKTAKKQNPLHSARQKGLNMRNSSVKQKTMSDIIPKHGNVDQEQTNPETPKNPKEKTKSRHSSVKSAKSEKVLQNRPTILSKAQLNELLRKHILSGNKTVTDHTDIKIKDNNKHRNNTFKHKKTIENESVTLAMEKDLKISNKLQAKPQDKLKQTHEDNNRKSEQSEDDFETDNTENSIEDQNQNSTFTLVETFVEQNENSTLDEILILKPELQYNNNTSKSHVPINPKKQIHQHKHKKPVHQQKPKKQSHKEKEEKHTKKKSNTVINKQSKHDTRPDENKNIKTTEPSETKTEEKTDKIHKTKPLKPKQLLLPSIDNEQHEVTQKTTKLQKSPEKSLTEPAKLKPKFVPQKNITGHKNNSVQNATFLYFDDSFEETTEKYSPQIKLSETEIQQSSTYAARESYSSSLVVVSFALIVSTVLLTIVGVYYRQISFGRRRWYIGHSLLENEDEMPLFNRETYQEYHDDIDGYESWKSLRA